MPSRVPRPQRPSSRSTHNGRAAARIRASLETAGQPIGVNDLHIAAHARSEGLTLVTNNISEFERVPGLLVENWVGNLS